MLLQGHTKEVNSVAFSPRSDIIASGSRDKTVRIWDSNTGKEIAKFENDQDIDSVVFSPKEDKIACGGIAELSIWDINTERRIRKSSEKLHFLYISSIAFSPEGERMITGSSGADIKCNIRILDLNLNLINTFESGSNHLNSLAVSPLGDKFVCSFTFSSAAVFNSSTGKFKKINTYSSSATFSLRGDKILIGGDDGIIRLWNSKTNKEIKRIKATRLSINCVIFSPQEKMILSAGGYDKKIKLWDAVSGKILKTYEGHTHDVRSIAFNMKGNKFVSGSADNTIRLWSIPQLNV